MSNKNSCKEKISQTRLAVRQAAYVLCAVMSPTYFKVDSNEYRAYMNLLRAINHEFDVVRQLDSKPSLTKAA